MKEKDDDDVNKSFRNIISWIQLITKAQTRSTEPTTSSPKTTTRMTTTEMTPSSTTTATTTTAKPTTSTTTTTAEYTTTSTTTREITLPTTFAFVNNKIKRTMKIITLEVDTELIAKIMRTERETIQSHHIQETGLDHLHKKLVLSCIHTGLSSPVAKTKLTKCA